jgi:hypothetical protein
VLNGEEDIRRNDGRTHSGLFALRWPRWTVCAFVVLTFLFPNETIPAKQLALRRTVIARGTLIVYVPTKDGMVVAADSRRTISGTTTHCDDAEKIIPLKNHPRAVVANTGFSEVRDTTDTCDYAKTHPPKLSIGMLARDFLDAQHGDIREETFTSLAHQLLKRLQTLPKPPEPNHEGVILELTFGQYEANSHVAILAWFDICQDTPRTNHYSVCIHKWTEIVQTDPKKIQDFGDTQCFTEALTATGRQLLGPQFLNDFNHFTRTGPRTVAGVTHEEALAAAVDLIKSAEKISDLAVDSNCHIGGPIRAMLLDESHTRPFRLQ